MRSGAKVSSTKNSRTVPGVSNRPQRSSMARTPSARMSAALLIGGRGRRRRAAADQAGDAIIDHAHELEPREVGVRPHLHAAALGLHHLADRDADREAATVARRDDAVATLHALQRLGE